MLYDLITLLVLGYTTIRGAAKGMAWQLAGIAAVVLCFLFATPISLNIAPSIKLESPLNRWVAMLAIYVVFSFATFGLARMFKGWLEKEKFEDYDRHLGALFGLFKGMALSIVATFFIVAIAHPTRDYILHTYSGFAAAHIMDQIDPVMPGELQAIIAPYVHELDGPGMQMQADLGQPAGDYGEPAKDPFSAPPTGDAASANENWTVTAERLEKAVEDLLRKIPGKLDQELRSLVLAALKNTLPEDREELVDKMKSAPPEQIKPLAQAWRNGRPESSEQEETIRAGGSPEALVQEISREFSNRPNVQSAKVAEIHAALAGIPNQVQTAALTDWHADLLGLTPDPDPETDLTTPLDVRLVRQMQRAGVPMTRLASQVQQRLRSAVQR